MCQEGNGRLEVIILNEYYKTELGNKNKNIIVYKCWKIIFFELRNSYKVI